MPMVKCNVRGCVFLDYDNCTAAIIDIRDGNFCKTFMSDGNDEYAENNREHENEKEKFSTLRKLFMR